MLVAVELSLDDRPSASDCVLGIENKRHATQLLAFGNEEWHQQQHDIDGCNNKHGTRTNAYSTISITLLVMFSIT